MTDSLEIKCDDLFSILKYLCKLHNTLNGPNANQYTNIFIKVYLI